MGCHPESRSPSFSKRLRFCSGLLESPPLQGQVGLRGDSSLLSGDWQHTCLSSEDREKPCLEIVVSATFLKAVTILRVNNKGRRS